MLKKKAENPAVYCLILTSMSAKFYLGTCPWFVQFIVNYSY
ncbi:hypothetical protein HanPSC8_Chr04g0154111 [Helianthus annuus]|nr:hypothetical protein HanPSC8_Chr04g0154111 [Helianthus annuus]